MKRAAYILVVFMVLTLSQIGHAEISISFKSGECAVDLYGDGNWENAILNMNLYRGSVVKTEADGKVEIEIEGEKIAIGSSTAVSINYIIDNLSKRDKVGWFQKITGLFHSMIGATGEDSDMVTLGTRGDLEAEEEIDWMGDFEEEDIIAQVETGKEYYTQGKYADAINVFSELIYNEDTADMRGEVAYYLGSSLFNSVQYEEALPHLRESIRDKSGYYRQAALMQYSFACFFTGQYEKAIDGYITYIEEFEEGELKPYALLMIGKSYKATGNNESARVYFNEIKDIYEEPIDVYLDAVNELREM
jgi:tetratricopeptide (TPR) repeat protein